MANHYDTQVQWGGTAAPWHDNGIFTIGGREGQRAVGLWATSTDDGLTLTGEMQYGKSSQWPNGEGKIGFRAKNVGGNNYDTEVQWGGTDAPWRPNGRFVLGGRDGQRLVGIQVSSADDGKTFTGQMRYGKSAQWPNGEGEIGFRATYVEDKPIYRLFLGATGDHLYTNDKAERDLRLSEHWNDEGVAFVLFAESRANTKPLFRLFSMKGSAHIVTSDAARKQKLVAEGWADEGVLGHIHDSQGIPVYVLTAMSGTQIIDVVATTATAERDHLLSCG
ncbi:MAG: hypothetical protein KC457_16435, partial [Myxococcales bacterium]|nr:hypothetical protein [Myxococcales bacterium]